ncbi:MAG: CRISPR-associated endonuclease Cas1 [Candidatus Methanomethylicaceae archaeon]
MSSKMKRLIVDGFGKFVRREGNQIIVSDKGKVLHRVLAEELRQVVIAGSGGISFDAMELLGENGVDLIKVDWKGDVVCRLSSSMMRTVHTRREQYYAYNDERGGHLSKAFITGKAKNQYALLGTIAKSRSETSPETGIILLNARDEIGKNIRLISTIPDRPCSEIRSELLGIEGSSSKTYWEALSAVIPTDFGFPGRSGRYAKDPINAMLNYGYALLEGEVWRAVHYSGLDPYGGFLHVDRPGKASLVLDLMEEFRQQVVDRNVFSIVNRKMVDPSEFETEGGVCRLKDRPKRLLIESIESQFEEYLRFKEMKLRWTDLIMGQAVEVAKYLRGEVSKYEPFYLRW